MKRKNCVKTGFVTERKNSCFDSITNVAFVIRTATTATTTSTPERLNVPYQR